MVRNSHRARSGALSSSATSIPSTSSSAVETKVKYAVRSTAVQNSDWPSANV